MPSQRVRPWLLVGAAAQLVLLTVIAMLVYPGGAVCEPAGDHYLFLGNFFSDLGATRTYSGRSNIPRTRSSASPWPWSGSRSWRSRRPGGSSFGARARALASGA